MPILEKDIDVSPASLLTASDSATRENRWYALYTKPRQEKVLVRRLSVMGKSFCGLLTPNRIRMPSGRIKTSHIPLFPGYVFLYGTDVDRYDSLCTRCVISVLPVCDGEALRRDLRKIHVAIMSGYRVTRADRLQRGQLVRVVAGPLAGQTGLFLSRKSHSRLLISLAFIQQGALVEMDESLVEAA